jgi:serine/threonine protein phosphatase PrpC
MAMENSPSEPIEEILKQTFKDVDEKGIKKIAGESGCTAVTALLRIEDCRRVLYCAGVGDSRAMLCKGGKAVRLTNDHRLSNTEEADRIKAAGGTIIGDRVCGMLAVTRSLGDVDYKFDDIGHPVIADPEQDERVLDDEDEFVILASDGVSSTLPPQHATPGTTDSCRSFRSSYGMF